MLRLLTDFNDIDARSMVTALLSDADAPVREGGRVLLYDDGEHEVWGTVARLGDSLLEIELDWDTWGPAGRYHVDRLGAWNVGWMYTGPSALAASIPAPMMNLPGANVPATTPA